MIVSAVDLSLGRVCYIRSDVTEVLAAERKAKEELEQALEEAKKANRVKSDFLSSMSHDIRTPINAIVGMTTLALANMEEKEKVAEYLHKISISSQHLLSLINDILHMSQIEQSKIHLNCQKIQIEELMDHVSSIMSSQAVNAGLQFKIEGSAVGGDGTDFRAGAGRSMGEICICQRTSGRKIYRGAKDRIYQKGKCMRTSVGRAYCKCILYERFSSFGKTDGIAHKNAECTDRRRCGFICTVCAAG